MIATMEKTEEIATAEERILEALAAEGFTPERAEAAREAAHAEIREVYLSE